MQVSRFCSPLCISEGGGYLGLEGRTGWSKAGGGKAGSVARMAPHGGPGPQRGYLLSTLSPRERTRLKMSLYILPHNEMTCVDKASAFHNLIFVAIPSRRMLGIETICIC